jgi:hypothetical protein
LGSLKVTDERGSIPPTKDSIVARNVERKRGDGINSFECGMQSW